VRCAGQGGRAGQAADLCARLWLVESHLQGHAPSPGLARHRCRAGWSSWVPAARLQKRRNQCGWSLRLFVRRRRVPAWVFEIFRALRSSYLKQGSSRASPICQAEHTCFTSRRCSREPPSVRTGSCDRFKICPLSAEDRKLSTCATRRREAVSVSTCRQRRAAGFGPD